MGPFSRHLKFRAEKAEKPDAKPLRPVDGDDTARKDAQVEVENLLSDLVEDSSGAAASKDDAARDPMPNAFADDAAEKPNQAKATPPAEDVDIAALVGDITAAPETPKAEAPKPEAPARAEAPKAEAPKAPEPQAAPAPKSEAPAAPKAEAPTAPQPSAAAGAAAAATGAAAAGGKKSSRVKTTFLGFDGGDDDMFNMAELDAAAPPTTARGTEGLYPTGWLVIIDGPGRGNSFTLSQGLMSIGRGDDQNVALDFGDMAISRDGHASIAFDAASRAFYVGHGSKSNIVRLNGKPLLSTEQITTGDVIQVGETQLRLVAFCGEDFCWSKA